MILRNYIQISQKKVKKKGLLCHVGVFYQNLGITTCTLENYSNFKSGRSILEIHDLVYAIKSNAGLDKIKGKSEKNEGNACTPCKDKQK